MSGSRKYTVEEHGPRIRQFLEPVLAAAHLELKFDAVPGRTVHPEIEDPHLMVIFTGQDVDLLLANKGELMLALEHLTLEILDVPSDEHALLCFDANDYRVMRIEELRMTAQTAAERVIKTGDHFQFNPMTSRERRIIHLALRGETRVKSESFGTGPVRQVVIYRADLPAPTNIVLKPVPRPRRDDERENDRGDRRGRDRDRRGPGGSGPRRGPRPRNT
ncbi:MAG TPA: R3H domain-containing nucleic acid-binding protein [Bryobacteraceae bacterium]|nr:R3H domain-containing nucleic acid-binding protein [Bryobacteraceae bacterium]